MTINTLWRHYWLALEAGHTRQAQAITWLVAGYRGWVWQPTPMAMLAAATAGAVLGLYAGV